MGVMLILPDVRDHEYAHQRALDTWDCVSSLEAIRVINEDERGAVCAVYGLGSDVGLVIDALDNYTKACIRLIVIHGNSKDEPPHQFNGPWELVYRG